MRAMFLLLMIAGNTAFGADDSLKLGLDCGYWNTALVGDSAKVAKVLFVRGVYEGATALHVDIFDAAELAAKLEEQQHAAQVAELFEQRYYRQAGYLVLVDGLDKFCSDPQNETVWLTGAMKIVSMRLRGESSEAIAVQVSRMRQEPGP